MQTLLTWDARDEAESKAGLLMSEYPPLFDALATRWAIPHPCPPIILYSQTASSLALILLPSRRVACLCAMWLRCSSCFWAQHSAQSQRSNWCGARNRQVTLGVDRLGALVQERLPRELTRNLTIENGDLIRSSAARFLEIGTSVKRLEMIIDDHRTT
jgi:hypothetical protein